MVAHVQQRKALVPALDDLLHAEREGERRARRLGAVKLGAVRKGADILDQHDLAGMRLGAGAVDRDGVLEAGGRGGEFRRDIGGRGRDRHQGSEEQGKVTHGAKVDALSFPRNPSYGL